MIKPVYKRVLLKLSGESLMGSQGYGIDGAMVESYASQIKEAADSGVRLGIVIPGLQARLDNYKLPL